MFIVYVVGYRYRLADTKLYSAYFLALDEK